MPAMRILALSLLVMSGNALADLYRWIDPETGSVKFSNQPPLIVPGQRLPANVEVLPYKPLGYVAPQAGAAPKPAAAAPAAAAAPSAPTGALGALESRWRSMLESFTGITRADFDRSADAFKQQAEAYSAVSAELDRMDPAGAARRRAAEAEKSGVIEQIFKGLSAGVSTSPIQK